MKYRRYGTFRFKDYWACWLGIVCFSLFLVFSILTYNMGTDLTSILVLIVSLLCLLYLLWGIFSPHHEFFLLYGDKIIAHKGRTSVNIPLPSQLTIVISLADLWLPLSRKMGISIVGKDSIILKDKYAVTLLLPSSADFVSEGIGPTITRRYSTTYATPHQKGSLPQLYASTVESAFPHHFLYSFVCTPSFLNSFLQGRNCLIYMPSSLSDIFPLPPEIPVHVDPNW